MMRAHGCYILRLQLKNRDIVYLRALAQGYEGLFYVDACPRKADRVNVHIAPEALTDVLDLFTSLAREVALRILSLRNWDGGKGAIR